jgi:hypothetical protein
MIVGRHTRGSRAITGIAISAALLFAACGGSGSSKANTTTPPTDAAAGATTTTGGSSGGGNGSCYTTPGKQKARVRFVNLFTNTTYPSSDIDVYQGYEASDPCGKKLATVPFGHASDYIDVTASDDSGNWNATAYVAGSAAKDHEIITQSETWKGGEQVTITFQGGEHQADLPASAGGDQAFFESPTTDASSALKAVAGKAVLGIAATSLQYVDPNGAWVAGLAGQPACLQALGDTSSTRTNIGGTQLVPYTVAPGSLSLGLYPSDPGKCTGPPQIGPATIDAAAGSRTLVFAYGTSPKELKLLVLPIAS